MKRILTACLVASIFVVPAVYSIPTAYQIKTGNENVGCLLICSDEDEINGQNVETVFKELYEKSLLQHDWEKPFNFAGAKLLTLNIYNNSSNQILFKKPEKFSFFDLTKLVTGVSSLEKRYQYYQLDLWGACLIGFGLLGTNVASLALAGFGVAATMSFAEKKEFMAKMRSMLSSACADNQLCVGDSQWPLQIDPGKTVVKNLLYVGDIEQFCKKIDYDFSRYFVVQE